MRSSNRTFMELKWLSGKHVTMGKVSSNRTFMELKCVFHGLGGFRRTF